jgi:F-type H+-transporting ATPase subunit gamma
VFTLAPCVVKQRIRAIKNIGKITKAMKMVAASKMRNALVAVEESRGMVQPFTRVFGDHPGTKFEHVLGMPRC